MESTLSAETNLVLKLIFEDHPRLLHYGGVDYSHVFTPLNKTKLTLCGCDYFPKTKEIGAKEVLAALNKYPTLDEAASSLGINKSTLKNKINKFGIRKVYEN